MYICIDNSIFSMSVCICVGIKYLLIEYGFRPLSGVLASGSGIRDLLCWVDVDLVYVLVACGNAYLSRFVL